MSISRKEPLFSLADQLFNANTVEHFAGRVAKAHHKFDQAAFTRQVLAEFPSLELKARINFMVDALEDQLPEDYDQAIAILLKALPPPLDPTRSDDDFGEYIWVVPGEYVAKHGCTAARLQASLSFLRESTMRFTSEGAIRPFLADFPRETLAFFHDCAANDHYHVRRLASEGIRPYLPWARRVALPFEDIVEVLDMLHADRTRYVTRSVSNALNDLSRDDPDLVIGTLQRWQKKRRQNSKELEWMTNHALRTLTKAGHNEALELLGFSSNPGFSLSGTVTDKRVKVGSSLTFGTTLRSQANQKLRISLQLHFLRADGTYTKKVFAIKDVSMNKGEHLDIKKSVSFKPISTRTLYPGKHYAEVLVNGTTRGKRSFELIR